MRPTSRIVGGGYTGLWTAYYLAGLRPDLRIVVLEAAFAGFGASGRNGGWVTAELPGSRANYARAAGRCHGRARARGGAAGRPWTRSGGCARPSRSTATSSGAGGCRWPPRQSQLARLREGLDAMSGSGATANDVLRLPVLRTSCAERVNVGGRAGRAVRAGLRADTARRARGRDRRRRRAPRRGDLRGDAGLAMILPSGGRAAGAVARTTSATCGRGSVLRCTEGYTAALPGRGGRCCR